MMLPNLAAVQEEASRSLADLARDMIRAQSSNHLAIEVRHASGEVVEEACFQWTMQRPQ